MVRIAVPDAHDKGHVALATTPPNEDAQRIGAPRVADIRVDDRRARDLKVRTDDDGRYVGVPEQYADKVRAFFAEEYGAEYDDVDGSDDGEATVEIDAAAVADALDAGECPFCEDYEGDAAVQHAAGAHPDKYAAYKEAGGGES